MNIFEKSSSHLTKFKSITLSLAFQMKKPSSKWSIFSLCNQAAPASRKYFEVSVFCCISETLIRGVMYRSQLYEIRAFKARNCVHMGKTCRLWYQIKYLKTIAQTWGTPPRQYPPSGQIAQSGPKYPSLHTQVLPSGPSSDLRATTLSKKILVYSIY